MLIQIKGLSNVKEEVYGALDSFIAWELEFPLITVKKALKTLEREREWKRIIQVHPSAVMSILEMISRVKGYLCKCFGLSQMMYVL